MTKYSPYLFFVGSKIQALLVFQRWLCVSAKPNVPECAVGFLHVAQRFGYA
tara:strand:- start:25 stop:177 length:153 start_codon:yes stop_codon:yes gene_type:complete